MKPKIKILLHSLMRDVSRGISTPEKAADEFKKATGESLEDVLDQADPKVGEFCAFLVGAYKIPTVQGPEVDLAALPEGFLETDPETQVTGQELIDKAQQAFETAKTQAEIQLQTINEATQEQPAPEAIEETPTGPFAEVVPVVTETNAPAVPVDQPARTRKTGKKPA